MHSLLHSITDTIRADTRGGVSAHIFPVEAGIYGGALGGAAMVIVAIVYGVLSGNGVWYPVNLIAATVIRQWQSAPAETFMQFNPTGLIFGAAIHIIVSVVIGVLFALLLPTLPGRPIFWAFIVGPVLWYGALIAALPLVNPVMAKYVDLPSFLVAHLVYSLVLGLSLERAPHVDPLARARS